MTVIIAKSILFCRVEAGTVNIAHDPTQVAIDFFGGPTLPLTGLRHLERRHRHATSIGGLARPKQYTSIHENILRLGCRWHVGAFTDKSHTRFDEVASVVGIDFVLCR